MIEVYGIILVIHLLSVVVAVGAVTVTDYLHIAGHRQKKLAQELLDVYPLLSKLISTALILVIISGTLLVYQKPEFLSKPLFQLKLSLVVILILNGLYLQKKIAPQIMICTINPELCSEKVKYRAAFAGILSLITWYAVTILALTKNFSYTVIQFVSVYLIVLCIAIGMTMYIENKFH
ncbi:hypothetical protein J4456_04525 [Candidatus Pacearchaeota archaeon]|nr:hypothetical protein [Candidatus Pacearchaeota archaeon]